MLSTCTAPLHSNIGTGGINPILKCDCAKEGIISLFFPVVCLLLHSLQSLTSSANESRETQVSHQRMAIGSLAKSPMFPTSCDTAARRACRF